MSTRSSAPVSGRLGPIQTIVLNASPGLLVVLYVLNTGSSADSFLTRLFNASYLGFGVQLLGSLAYFIVAGLIGHLKGDETEKTMEAARLYWLPAVMSMALLWMWMNAARRSELDSLVECVRESQESYEVAADALELGQPRRPRELTRRFSEVARDCLSYWSVDDRDLDFDF